MKGLEVACSARKVQNSLILQGILDLLFCNKRNSTSGVRNGTVRIVLTLCFDFSSKIAEFSNIEMSCPFIRRFLDADLETNVHISRLM